MNSRMRILLTMTATVIGGLSLVLYTTITKDILFKGLSFCKSSTEELLLGGTALFTSAVLAGFIATLIVVKDNYLPHFLISLFVVGKLFFVLICDNWYAPMWFETGSQFSLVAGLWLGRYGAIKFPLAPV